MSRHLFLQDARNYKLVNAFINCRRNEKASTENGVSSHPTIKTNLDLQSAEWF